MDNEKKLTYQQAKELQWFCKNVTGLKTEYYELLEKVEGLKSKMERLEKTCELIEKFLGEANG